MAEKGVQWGVQCMVEVFHTFGEGLVEGSAFRSRPLICALHAVVGVAGMQARRSREGERRKVWIVSCHHFHRRNRLLAYI